MGCADPLSKGVGVPYQCSRVNKKRSGWGEFVTYPFQRRDGSVKLHQQQDQEINIRNTLELLEQVVWDERKQRVLCGRDIVSL